ncbi:MAG: nucleotidyltransferase domain-containing protein [archaeon]
MLTPKQIRIFEAFLRKPYKDFTYKEIKKHSEEKSNSIIQKAIARYLSETLIKKQEVGNNIQYFLNLENSLVFSYFNILIKENASNLVSNSLKIIKAELSDASFVSIVIFGSYAEGKQNNNSDLDIAVFVSSTEEKKSCELAMKSAASKSLLRIDAHIITKEEMLLMLKDNHENLGKQIAHKHIAVQNPEIFYSILREGINNGFKIIYL